jgi:acyl-coenzyme A synthetase/AMP-(fatty) acid ligase
MIVTPEGLNVFPGDVESVLKQQPGVRDAAVIGTGRVQAVLILEDGANAEEIVRRANATPGRFPACAQFFDMAL